MDLTIMSTEDLVIALEQQKRYLAFLLEVKAGKLSAVPYGPETDEEISECVRLTARILARLCANGQREEDDIAASSLPF